MLPVLPQPLALTYQPQAVPEDRLPYFFMLDSTISLHSVLTHPSRWFLEIGKRHRMEAALEWLAAATPDFSLSLTTASCYRESAAQAVVPVLGERFGIPASHHMSIATCLHEVQANAVVHGNLSIDGSYEESGGFETYCEAVSWRLNQEPYKSRLMHIAAWNMGDHLKLVVRDEGDGFRRSPDAPNSLPYGRGLFLVQSLADKVWIGDDRRSLYMTFSYARA